MPNPPLGGREALAPMIPNLILLGLLFGRWWRVTLLVGTVGWPLLLLAADHVFRLKTGDVIYGFGPGDLAATAGMAFANTAVGVALHQAVLFMVRRLRWRKQPRPATSAPR